jgi:phosphatidylserine decarboxylase
MRPIPGLDTEAVPLLGVGLGLTGLALGLRPRLAPLPLALTALAAFLYRDPERATPEDASTIYAAADGALQRIDEYYEHRYLHTDAIRITTLVSPFDVAVSRSPAAGVVQYLEHIAGDHHSLRSPEAEAHNSRTCVGIKAAWGPLLVIMFAGVLGRRIVSHVQPGERIEAGERIGTVRFGSRIDLVVQRDSILPLAAVGQHMTAGRSRMAQVVPL